MSEDPLDKLIIRDPDELARLRQADSLRTGRRRAYSPRPRARKMTEETRALAWRLASRCESREDWLAVLRLGLDSILTDSAFLFSLLSERVEKEFANGKGPKTEILASIMRELGIKFTV